MVEDVWYQVLREKWKPKNTRLLLIGESPPDDGGNREDRRFFYAEPLSQADNLFRSVIAALYSDEKLTKGERKEPWLRCLWHDGIYLIDLTSKPVNALSSSARRQALREGIERCIELTTALEPEGIIICHAPSYALLRGPLRAAGLPLLHDEAVPFPLGNKRREFVEKVRVAVGGLPQPRIDDHGE